MLTHSLITSLLISSAALAESVLYMGKTYRDPRFVGIVDAQKVRIISAQDGACVIPWSALSSTFRRENQQRYDSLRLALDPAAAPKIKPLIKSLKEISTDKPGHLARLLWVQGELDVQDFYFGRYANAETTHFAFRIIGDREDGAGGVAHLYMPREQGAEVRKRLLSAGKTRALCLIEILKSRYDPGYAILTAELLDARPALD